MPSSGGRDTVVVGAVGRPYGVRGWVHVQSYTDPPTNLLDYRPWIVAGKPVEPTWETRGDRIAATWDGVLQRLWIDVRLAAAVFLGPEGHAFVEEPFGRAAGPGEGAADHGRSPDGVPSVAAKARMRIGSPSGS